MANIKISKPDEISGAVPASETISDKELLEMAQGVHLEKDHWEFKSSTRKEDIHFRREVRRAIYKILKWMRLDKDWNTESELRQLFDIIDPQLDPNLGMRWKNFGDKWDIHPKLPLKVIIKEHWVKEGGGFDADLGYHYPHAFPAKPNFNEG